MTAIKVVSKFYVKQVDCQVQGTNLKLASFSYYTLLGNSQNLYCYRFYHAIYRLRSSYVKKDVLLRSAIVLHFFNITKKVSFLDALRFLQLEGASRAYGIL